MRVKIKRHEGKLDDLLNSLREVMRATEKDVRAERPERLTVAEQKEMAKAVFEQRNTEGLAIYGPANWLRTSLALKHILMLPYVPYEEGDPGSLDVRIEAMVVEFMHMLGINANYTAEVLGMVQIKEGLRQGRKLEDILQEDPIDTNALVDEYKALMAKLEKAADAEDAKNDADEDGGTNLADVDDPNLQAKLEAAIHQVMTEAGYELEGPGVYKAPHHPQTTEANDPPNAP